MEFEGRIKKVLPQRSGKSQRTGNDWVSLPFVFEYFESEYDRYADSVLLETYDQNIIPHIKEGLEVKIGFYHRTREYDGKVYNEIRMYSIHFLKKEAKQPEEKPAEEQQLPPVEQPVVEQQPKDDLPF